MIEDRLRAVEFTCGGETVHMARGECWVFDSFRWHRVENGWTERRVHLVLDTVMTPTLRALVEQGLRQVVAEKRRKTPFRLRKASFKGNGLRPEMADAGWERLRDLAYEGRGS